MAYDLLIKNAKICDGTGAPAYSGSVAVDGGRIAEVGKVTGEAKRVIDGNGLVLAPGFIDPHTHFDAQISWDAMLTPSCWHGVTTVMMGNCGVGVAPARFADRSALAWDLVNVEALPHEVLMEGVAWGEWESFAQYMASIGRRRIALNTMFLVPLSALRFYVMGAAASEREANAEEIGRMTALFREAMEAGANGFSQSMQPAHIGYQGKPLAGRLASREELGALCHVMRDMRRGIVEIALNRPGGALSEENLDLLLFFARESQRPVTWLALLDSANFTAGANEQSMNLIRPYMQQGYRMPPQVSPRPIKSYQDLKNPTFCVPFPSWKKVFNRSVAEQMAIYRSADFRAAFRDDLAAGRGTAFNGQWDLVSVARVFKPHNQHLLNKSIAEVAKLQNKDAVDAMLDLALDEDLEMGLTLALVNYDPEAVAKLLSYPEAIFGLSDAGAHVGQHCEAGASTYVLEEWVRKRKVLTLERAVQRMTAEPAQFLGIPSKGRIAPGLDADLVLFDADSVKLKPLEWVNDLPCGQTRVIERSEGYAYTIVGGEVVFAGLEHQGPMPGKVVKPTA